MHDEETFDRFVSEHEECSPEFAALDLTDRRFIVVRDGEVERNEGGNCWLLDEAIAEIEKVRGSFHPAKKQKDESAI